MIISFEPSAFDDFNQWATVDKKCHKRIVNLIKDISRNPYQGLGKPEALKHELQGYWCRGALMMSIDWFTKSKTIG